MRLTRLRLRNFRNYTSLDFQPAQGFNYLFGQNGAGKTNLLEAIYFLIHLRSFRRIARSGVVREETDGMYLSGEFEGSDGGRGPHLEAAVHGRDRKYQIDGEEQSGVLGYLSQVHAAVFFPESLQIVKEGPATRRAFFDRAIASEDSVHLADSRAYNTLLSERNRLLKASTDSDTIHIWGQRLIEPAARIIARRRRYVESLQHHLTSIEERLRILPSGGVSVGYRGCGYGGAGEREQKEDIEACVRDDLTRHAKRLEGDEIRRGATLWGPHLDDFQISWRGKRAKAVASQGEQRLLVFSLVSATVESYREKWGDEPIVLLDDLSSELDQAKREDVLGFLETMGAQVFISSTEGPLRANDDKGAGYFLVDDGAVSPNH